MGPLGTLFSAIDTTKRKLGDLFSSPVQSAQQMVGHANDRARGLNELTSGAAQEMKQGLLTGGNTYGPQSQQLAQTIADAYNPMGMTVWHGSPHKFTKFDASKIGTGEGNQAYGHGLYVAESPNVAKSYQNLKPITDPTDFGFINARAAFDIAKGKPKKAIEWIDQRIARTKENAKFLTDGGNSEMQSLSRARQLIEEGAFSPGNLYKIDLPDEHIAKMLDWDKPLNQQPKEIQDIFGSSQKVTGAGALKSLSSSPDQYFSQAMSGRDLTSAMIDPTAGASEFLRLKGIPGIRYLDGGSRGTGAGTSNFVVFPGNEHLLQILERNGQLLK